jgi:myo-inositol-1(or 4)-monophosphatase
MDYANNLLELIDARLDDVIALRADFIEKADGSYVSKGDLLISDILKKYFARVYPQHIFVSEEDYENEKEWDTQGSYVFVDPIDGTENFVSGLKEWGVGVSVYTNGVHNGSLIYLPELNDFHFTGKKATIYNARIVGLSSSITSAELANRDYDDHEIRIIGCAMYNLLSAARGSFAYFENVKGVNCWDVLPGLNIALELGCDVWVDNLPYSGEILFPNKKYKIAMRQKNAG